MTKSQQNSHSLVIGYVLWVFGFLGSHRFYFGKQISGILWFFTFGLFFIGWLIDLFLMPSMDREADSRYTEGRINHSLAWILLTFLGVFGAHRIYMGKWLSGIIYLLTFGLLGIGILWDLLTLNEQVSNINITEILG